MILHYFSYGSNMSFARIKERVPSARTISVGRLPRYCLRFHKANKDGSAKCDAYYTGDLNDIIIGVYYEMELSDKPSLDRAEGKNYGYKEEVIKISLETGEIKEAFTYVATDINEKRIPYDWYKKHVVMGARENNLPIEYIQSIEDIQSIPDPDKKRSNKELSIYS